MTQQLRLAVVAALAVVLSALSLTAVLDDSRWIPPTVLAVVATVAGCEGGRRLGLARPLVPLLGAGALAAALTLLFARAEAWLLVLPTPGVVARLVDLGRDGLSDIEAYAAPVAAGAGLVLLVTGGIALVALLVDTVAVTYRRPAQSGLALLAVYTVPAATAPGGVGAAAFAVGAAGYLALLLTDARERVSRWGRALGRTERGEAQAVTTPLAALGRRVGVAAVATAVVLPVVAPGLADGLLDGGSGRGVGGGGSSTVVVVNPILDLGEDLRRPQNREVLRYTTTSDVPQYLRTVSLDSFTGDTWAPTGIRVPRTQTVEEYPSPPGLSPDVTRAPVTTDIQVQNLAGEWLPLPYPPQGVAGIEGDWLWDPTTFNTFSEDSDPRGQSYTVTSLAVSPSREVLTAAPAADPEAFARFLELPADAPEGIAETARQVTAGAAGPYARALALQQWLRVDGGFDYSEVAPGEDGYDGNGFDVIAAFLQERSGYCVQFASTMAVMARAVGVPARVAVGFTQGRPVGDDGEHTVTLHDAHAWPEIYVDGVGWLAFEPTPSRGAVPGYARPLPRDPLDPSSGGGPAAPPAAPGAGAATDPGAGADPRAQEGGGAVTATGAQLPWTGVVIAGAALLALTVPGLARVGLRRWRWSRGRDGAALASAAWAETCDDAADLRLPLRESETPRRYAERLVTEAGLDAEATAALRRVAVAVERSRYARSAGDPGDLRRDADRVRAGLRALGSRRDRLRAVLLPVSSLVLARRAGERLADLLADLLDGVDRAVAATGRTARRLGVDHVGWVAARLTGRTRQVRRTSAT